MATTPIHQKLASYRKKIDKLDKSLLSNLSKRMSLVKEMGTFKKTNHISIIQRNREKEIVWSLSNAAKSKGLSKELMQKIFAAIFAEGRRLQKSLKK